MVLKSLSRNFCRGGKMKANKKMIYDFMKSVDLLNVSKGLSTIEISEQLNLQRSNVSSLLNSLVDEGYLNKSNTRPVLYSIKRFMSDEDDIGSFTNLIGSKGSLKSVIELAKASILYPMGSLNSAIVGSSGVGVTYFVQLMYMFAKEKNVSKADRPLVRFNCRHFINEPDEMLRQLFGQAQDVFINMMDKSADSFLFIDHVEALPAIGKTKLITALESREYTEIETGVKKKITNTIIVGVDSRAKNSEEILDKFTIVMHLEELSQKNLNERLALIDHFFTLESMQTSKVLKVNHEVVICLLLYNCKGNVKQLRNDIKIACANAYVREHANKQDEIQIYLNNFQPYVREGFLEYKRKRSEISELIPVKKNYRYDGNNEKRSEVIDIEMGNESLYEHLDNRIGPLRSEGMTESEINGILSSDLSQIVKKYTGSMETNMDTQQLSKIVSSELIDAVKDFLKNAGLKFSQTYDDGVLFGLCLHLNGLLLREAKTDLDVSRLNSIMMEYKQEYAFTLEYSQTFERILGLTLPVEEVMLITVFLTNGEYLQKQDSKPSVVIAMHGNSTASSMVSVIKGLSKNDNVYSFDLNMETEPMDAYADFTKLLHSINNKHGIILVYDMGSFETMGKIFSEENNIELELVQIPVTLLALDIVRRTNVHSNLKEIHKQTINSLHTLINKKGISVSEKKTIVTLCNTGEGGALQVKTYLENNKIDRKYRIINVSLDGLETLDSIVNRDNIQAIIGTVDPKLDGLNFIPIQNLFKVDQSKLFDLIDGEKIHDQYYTQEDLIQLKTYLKEQIHSYDIEKLDPLLNIVLEEFSKISDSFTSYHYLGVYVHIASVIDRNIRKDRIPVCLKKEVILTKYKEDFVRVSSALALIEKEFKIVISDDEMATIVSLVKQI